MKILITGSSGYIGQSLIQFLKEKGYEIIEFDKQNEEIQDLTNIFNIQNVFSKNKKIDSVIHLAALAGVEKNTDEYNDYLRNNLNATFNLLEVMRINNVKNLIFSSSCSVYGNNNNCKETDKLFPESFYGLSKVMCEEMIKFYGHKFDINYQILRIFNVIGRGVDSDFQKNRLIPKILEKIKNGQPIDIYLQKNKTFNKEKTYAYSQVRDYVDIKYVINLIHELLLNPRSNETFNIASGEWHCGEKIVNICDTLLKKSSFLNHCNGRNGDCDYQKANVDKIKNLGLYQKTDIKEIIKDIIDKNE